MDRDMSYELDDAFGMRDAGEVQPLPVTKTKVLRTPGLAPIFSPNEVTKIRDAEVVGPATGMAGAEIDLPVIGRVNLVHVGIAVALGYVACKMLAKKA